MIKEACVTTRKEAEQALALGAQRLELCTNLSCGGCSPHAQLIQEVVALTQKKEVLLMLMVRPRSGNFIYTPEEIDAMGQWIQQWKVLPQVGFVFGCLTKEQKIDVAACQYLCQCATPCPCTFHMAFDCLSPSEQLTALAQLKDCGFQQVLTHGGPLNLPLQKTKTHLLNLAQVCQKLSFQLLIGGGVTNELLPSLQASFPTADFHGTKIVGDLHEA